LRKKLKKAGEKAKKSEKSEEGVEKATPIDCNPIHSTLISHVALRRREIDSDFDGDFDFDGGPFDRIGIKS